MSIMLIFLAFTVPRQWSAVMRRERELQTIYVMQQYAKAIEAFRLKNNIFPVSMSQLADARQPRFLRCPKDGCLDPLTGRGKDREHTVPQQLSFDGGAGVIADDGAEGGVEVAGLVAEGGVAQALGEGGGLGDVGEEDGGHAGREVCLGPDQLLVVTTLLKEVVDHVVRIIC